MQQAYDPEAFIKQKINKKKVFRRFQKAVSYRRDNIAERERLLPNLFEDILSRKVDIESAVKAKKGFLTYNNIWISGENIKELVKDIESKTGINKSEFLDKLKTQTIKYLKPVSFSSTIDLNTLADLPETITKEKVAEKEVTFGTIYVTNNPLSNYNYVPTSLKNQYIEVTRIEYAILLEKDTVIEYTQLETTSPLLYCSLTLDKSDTIVFNKVDQIIFNDANFLRCEISKSVEGTVETGEIVAPVSFFTGYVPNRANNSLKYTNDNKVTCILKKGEEGKIITNFNGDYKDLYRYKIESLEMTGNKVIIRSKMNVTTYGIWKITYNKTNSTPRNSILYKVTVESSQLVKCLEFIGVEHIGLYNKAYEPIIKEDILAFKKAATGLAMFKKMHNWIKQIVSFYTRQDISKALTSDFTKMYTHMYDLYSFVSQIKTFNLDFLIEPTIHFYNYYPDKLQKKIPRFISEITFLKEMITGKDNFFYAALEKILITNLKLPKFSDSKTTDMVAKMRPSEKITFESFLMNVVNFYESASLEKGLVNILPGSDFNPTSIILTAQVKEHIADGAKFFLSIEEESNEFKTKQITNELLQASNIYATENKGPDFVRKSQTLPLKAYVTACITYKTLENIYSLLSNPQISNFDFITIDTTNSYKTALNTAYTKVYSALKTNIVESSYSNEIGKLDAINLPYSYLLWVGVIKEETIGADTNVIVINNLKNVEEQGVLTKTIWNTKGKGIEPLLYYLACKGYEIEPGYPTDEFLKEIAKAYEKNPNKVESIENLEEKINSISDLIIPDCMDSLNKLISANNSIFSKFLKKKTSEQQQNEEYMGMEEEGDNPSVLVGTLKKRTGKRTGKRTIKEAEDLQTEADRFKEGKSGGKRFVRSYVPPK